LLFAALSGIALHIRPFLGDEAFPNPDAMRQTVLLVAGGLFGGVCWVYEADTPAFGFGRHVGELQRAVDARAEQPVAFKAMVMASPKEPTWR
jgi:hypothetical protein